MSPQPRLVVSFESKRVKVPTTQSVDTGHWTHTPIANGPACAESPKSRAVASVPSIFLRERANVEWTPTRRINQSRVSSSPCFWILALSLSPYFYLFSLYIGSNRTKIGTNSRGTTRRGDKKIRERSMARWQNEPSNKSRGWTMGQNIVGLKLQVARPRRTYYRSRKINFCHRVCPCRSVNILCKKKGLKNAKENGIFTNI